jgi:hypothetical protein
MNAMSPERWQRVEKLYDSAIKLEPGHGTPFLVLKLGEGGTLADRLKKSRIPLTKHSTSAARLPKASKPHVKEASSTAT